MSACHWPDLKERFPVYFPFAPIWRILLRLGRPTRADLNHGGSEQMFRLSPKTGWVVTVCIVVLGLGIAAHAEQQFLCCASVAGPTAATKGSSSSTTSPGATLFGCVFTNQDDANRCPIAAQCPTFVCQGPSTTSPPIGVGGKGVVAKDCTCGDAQISCPTGQSLCSGTCLDLSSDPNNCGKCGFACGSGNTCLGGGCYNLTQLPK